MPSRRWFARGQDVLTVRASPFIRYGLEHTIRKPFRVQRATFGQGWEIIANVDGPYSYSGTLVTCAVTASDKNGHTRYFRTRADALSALETVNKREMHDA